MYTDGPCLVHEVGQHLGSNIRDSIIDFILDAEDGARLVLQKNREGFTVQVTGGVKRSAKNEALDAGVLRSIQQRMRDMERSKIRRKSAKQTT